MRKNVLPAIQHIIFVLNGGEGSGNFGHAGRPGKVGGSQERGKGKNKKEGLEKEFFDALYSMNYTENRNDFPGKENVKKEEEEIKKDRVEHKVIFDKNGNIIEKSGGKQYSNAGKNESSFDEVRGGIVTHNHPVSYGRTEFWQMGFSDADYKYAEYYELSEFRATGPDWVSIVRPPESGWPNMRNVTKDWRGYRGQADDISDEIMSNFIKSLTYEKYSDAWHNAVDTKRRELDYFSGVLVDQAISKKYGLSYEAYTTR